MISIFRVWITGTALCLFLAGCNAGLLNIAVLEATAACAPFGGIKAIISPDIGIYDSHYYKVTCQDGKIIMARAKDKDKLQ